MEIMTSQIKSIFQDDNIHKVSSMIPAYAAVKHKSSVEANMVITRSFCSLNAVYISSMIAVYAAYMLQSSVTAVDKQHRFAAYAALQRTLQIRFQY